MDFDLTKVYHALDAEDVHVGSLVYGAQCAADLKAKVREDSSKFVLKVIGIQEGNTSMRFKCLSTTGFTVCIEYVYMLFDVDSDFYDLALAQFEGKPIWCKYPSDNFWSIVNGPCSFGLPREAYTLVDPNALRMHEEIKGLYNFNYKGFDCELADCSSTDRYVCFVDYWDSEDEAPNTDLVEWSWGSEFDLGDNYVVPEFIIKGLDNWIKKNPSKRNH